MIVMLIFLILIFHSNAFEFVDFDTSMKKELYIETTQLGSFATWYSYLKEIYEKIKNSPNNTQHLRIPKIIHQIWLGSPFPDRYKRLQETWQMQGWEYKLWTDADAANFNFYNKEYFDSAHNYGEKADIWRYEILEQFGGVYVDIDFERLNPIEELHYLFDLYVGIQPLDTKAVQLGIGIIGASPHHPILKTCVKLLYLHRHYEQIILRTGPLYFTRIFCSFAKEFSTKNIALPASYFYPCGYNQEINDFYSWHCPEAFAVHHWAGSWLKH